MIDDSYFNPVQRKHVLSLWKLCASAGLVQAVSKHGYMDVDLDKVEGEVNQMKRELDDIVAAYNKATGDDLTLSVLIQELSAGGLV